MKLYIDASAITNFTDTFFKRYDPPKFIGDRYVLVAPFQNTIQRLPISDLIKNLPKAMDDGLASIDAKSFAKVDIDDYGKKINAKY